jgi:CheY-like chemotaxis protein
VASLLGCALEVTSIVGQGSCFTVSVPRAVGQTSQNEATKHDKTVPAGALVLVIDDDVAVADATAMLLGAAGLDVVVAIDVAQALRIVGDHGRLPNLLICDYHLGRNQTGIEAIRAIREAIRLNVPTILVSGDTSAARGMLWRVACPRTRPPRRLWSPFGSSVT